MPTFFESLDTFQFFAGDLHQRLPIDPGRLQMLVKRHYPHSEAAQGLSGGKRQYTPRMAIWLMMTNELMNLGVAVGAASKMSQFTFYALNDMYADLASGDKELQKKHASTVAVAMTSSNPLIEPHFVLFPGKSDVSSSAITLPIGALLLRLASSFDTDLTA